MERGRCDLINQSLLPLNIKSFIGPEERLGKRKRVIKCHLKTKVKFTVKTRWKRTVKRGRDDDKTEHNGEKVCP